MYLVSCITLPVVPHTYRRLHGNRLTPLIISPAMWFSPPQQHQQHLQPLHDRQHRWHQEQERAAIAEELQRRGCSELALWATLATFEGPCLAPSTEVVHGGAPLQRFLQVPEHSRPRVREREDTWYSLSVGSKRMKHKNGQSTGSAIAPLDADGFTLS